MPDSTKNSSPQQVLAFDFGTRHIGIASGQSLTKHPEPLCQIKSMDGKPDWQALDGIIDEWQPNALIIGLPLNMDGSESEMSLRAKKFSNRLADRYQLPCHLVDERLSSFEVKQRYSIKEREIDSLAAAVILQSWFDQL